MLALWPKRLPSKAIRKYFGFWISVVAIRTCLETALQFCPAATKSTHTLLLTRRLQRQAQHPLFEITVRLLYDLRPELLNAFITLMGQMKIEAAGEVSSALSINSDLCRR